MGTRVPPNFLTGTKTPSEQPQISAGFHPYGAATPAGIFSTDVHDNLIKSKGHKSTHYRHALDPNRQAIDGGANISQAPDVGAVNLYDPRPFYVAIQQLNWQDRYIIQGVHSDMTVMTVNYTTYYETQVEPRERVFLRKNDIITVDSGHTVLVPQLFEYKPAGPQRMKFPIVDVDYLVDGNRNRYEKDIDFIIKDGLLEWVGTKRPLWYADKGMGEVLSINYWTKPVFSVVSTNRVFREVFTNPSGNAAQPSDATYISGSAVVQALWIDTHLQPNLPDWPRVLEPDRSQLTRS